MAARSRSQADILVMVRSRRSMARRRVTVAALCAALGIQAAESAGGAPTGSLSRPYDVFSSAEDQALSGAANAESRAHHRTAQIPTITNAEAPGGARGVKRQLAGGGGGPNEVNPETVGLDTGAMPTTVHHDSSGKCGSSSSSISGGEDHDGAGFLTASAGVVPERTMSDMCLHDNDGGETLWAPIEASATSSTENGLSLGASSVPSLASGTRVPRERRTSPADQTADTTENMKERNDSALASHGWTTSSSVDVEVHAQPGLDPWELYEVVAEADPVTSWEILREAQLSYYTFKYDRRKGRRHLGVLPSEVGRLMPEALSTFTLPVVLPDGSRSRVEGVPNVDWTYLFAHTVVATQELSRRFDELETRTKILKTESEKGSLRLTRLMEEQDEDWQPAASLRVHAAVAELKRDIIKSKLELQKVAGEERRRWLERKHNQTLAAAEIDLGVTMGLAEEKTFLALESMKWQEQGMQELVVTEESLRRSTELALLMLDIQNANQTAKLAANRRLSESIVAVHERAAAEREGEAADVARIRTKGEEARKQTQAVVDDTFVLVGAIVLSVVSDPAKLVKSMAVFLGLAFASLLVANTATLAARVVRRRITKPQLVRETDVPGSLPAVAIGLIRRSARALLGLKSGQSGMDPMSTQALQGIVLPPDVEGRLCILANSIRSSCARGAPLPHVLIHGATGSGKTLLARRLTTMCGLNRAIVAGGDVGPLGAAASSELGGLMRWARSAGGGCRMGFGRKRKGSGVALVMDEAEAALGDRRRGMSENARSALNAVLLHTGELVPGFMMILTTSRPQDLDEAVLDRVDEVIHLPTPTLVERTRLARQYLSIYLHHDPPADFLPVCEHRDSNKHAAATNSQKEEHTLVSPTATATPEPEEGGDTKEAPPVARCDGRKGEAIKNSKRSSATPLTQADPGDASARCGTVAKNGETSGICSISAKHFLFFSGRRQRQEKYHRAEEGRPAPSSRRRAGNSVTDHSTPTDTLGDDDKYSPNWRLWFGKRRNRGGVVRLGEGFREKAAGLMAKLAVRSEGFYGRDMARLFSAMQAAAYGSEECELTVELWLSIERQKLKEFNAKAVMTTNTQAPPRTRPSGVTATVSNDTTAENLSPTATTERIICGGVERGANNNDRCSIKKSPLDCEPTKGHQQRQQQGRPTDTDVNVQSFYEWPNKRRGSADISDDNATSAGSIGGVAFLPVAVGAAQAENVVRHGPYASCDPEITRPEASAPDSDREGNTALF